jgi:hypothetical protein
LQSTEVKKLVIQNGAPAHIELKPTYLSKKTRSRSRSAGKVSKSMMHRETELRLMNFGAELKYRKQAAKNLMD